MKTEERGPTEKPLGGRPPEGAGAQQEGQREVASKNAAAGETVPLPILATKLHRPPVAPDILPRARLLEQLNEGRQRPLTLISAPAGYGKSTLASRWQEACDGLGIWVSLDEDDNDLRSFLAYLLAAVQAAVPNSCHKTQALLDAANLPPGLVLTRYLLNDLDQIDEPFILVLDDYHHIHERAVHDVLAALLDHPPRAMHLVLLTRRDPPLPISTLRARAQMTEIGAQQLRFTVAETVAFLQGILKVSVSARLAMVGSCNAGSTERTSVKLLRGTFIISPTIPSAAIAPLSISTISSIFCFFHGQDHKPHRPAPGLKPGLVSNFRAG